MSALAELFDAIGVLWRVGDLDSFQLTDWQRAAIRTADRHPKLCAVGCGSDLLAQVHLSGQVSGPPVVVERVRLQLLDELHRAHRARPPAPRPPAPRPTVTRLPPILTRHADLELKRQEYERQCGFALGPAIEMRGADGVLIGYRWPRKD